MKTYLFDTFNRFKKYSEKLDVQTVLCSKAWWVFNDSGEKEVYVFKPDNTIIISLSGKVTRGTWEYLAVNKTITIAAANQEYMVKPAFVDGNILALNIDGTKEYAFLIDENRSEFLNLITYSDIKGYFAEKERKNIEEEAKKLEEERKRIEEEREKEELRKKAYEERRKKEEEQIKRNEFEERLVKEANELYLSITKKYFSYGWTLILFVITILSMAIGIEMYNEYKLFFILIPAFITVVIFIVTIIYNVSTEFKNESVVNKYIEEHPDDKRSKYLMYIHKQKTE